MKTCSLGRNDMAFEAMYGDTRGISALVSAIRGNKAERGEIRRRRSKNGSPSQRFSSEESEDMDGSD